MLCEYEKYNIHESSKDEVVYSIGESFNFTSIVLGSEIRFLASVTLVNPSVPIEPLTEKPSTLLLESNSKEGYG